MSKKPIPGPWRLEGVWSDRRVEFDYTDEVGNGHSGNIGVIDGMRGEQNEANARLVAAAPDLLAALKFCMGESCQATHFSSPNYKGGRECGLCQYCVAKAAIKKAEGTD